MSSKAEYKNGIVILAACLFGCALLALFAYFSGKLPVILQQVIAFGLIIWFMVAVFRANQKRSYLSFGRGVESESAYSILGVTIRATGKEIRQAYRALAGKYHPDNYPEDQKAMATALLLRINRAYEMIGDEDARFEYDALVRFHDPSAPPFDEAYAHFLEWRNHGGGNYGDVEYWGDPLEPLDTDHSPQPDSPEESPEYPIPAPTPNADRDDSAQDLQSSASVPLPEVLRNTSSECPACGEPYSRQSGRSGPMYCERCGEDLSTGAD